MCVDAAHANTHVSAQCIIAAVATACAAVFAVPRPGLVLGLVRMTLAYLQ